MNSPIIFLVTGADHIKGCNPILKRERYIEYTLSLHKIFHYSYPVIGVLSEYDKENNKDCPPFESFPFQTLTKIVRGEFDGYNKSIRECVSIIRLLQEVPAIDDDTFIIKISGRYLIMDDSFITIVKNNVSNHNIVAVIKTAVNEQNEPLQYTFLYALRYRYMKAFYEKYKHEVSDDISVEYRIFEFLKQNQLLQSTIMVNQLGILANINNDDFFQMM